MTNVALKCFCKKIYTLYQYGICNKIADTQVSTETLLLQRLPTLKPASIQVAIFLLLTYYYTFSTLK